MFQIEEVFEIWYYEETSTHIFKNYINKFISLKLQNSKIPQEFFGTELQYCNVIEERDHIRLNPTHFQLGEISAAKRSVAKLLVNSLWGVRI